MTGWLGWLRWIRVNGFGFPAEPILRTLAQNIRLMDAILAPGSAGVPPAVNAGEDTGKMSVPPSYAPTAANAKRLNEFREN